MGRVNYTSQEIICSTVVLMEWTLGTLGLFAWEVALQDELADLKDHVSPITLDDITYDKNISLIIDLIKEIDKVYIQLSNGV